MGWNSWNRFGPFISERLVLETADAMVATGMRDAGYRYVVIDDAWEGSLRSDDGDLVEDRWAFPHGLAWLADQIHGRGLRFGLYTCAGDRTCQGYPGSRGNEARDARRFAAWGVDLIKVDWCHTQGMRGDAAYAVWSDAIRAAGRPMVLSICEWGRGRPWEWAPRLGHLWRTSADIADTWASVLATLDAQVELHDAAGPDHWNDPDMLEVGNGGMSELEYRTHFSLWAMLAAPLMAGNDVRAMSAETRLILTAPEVIAIDQDALGRQGRRILTDGGAEVWMRTLADGAWAILALNRGEAARSLSLLWRELGAPAGPLVVRDLWERRDVAAPDGVEVSLAPHAAALWKVGGPAE